MSKLVLIESITASDKVIESKIDHTVEHGYLELETIDWTAAMFYSLPMIHILIKRKDNIIYDRYLNTYNPDSIGRNLTLTSRMQNLVIDDIIIVKPVFDDVTIFARNQLIDLGFESGEKFEFYSDTYKIRISIAN